MRSTLGEEPGIEMSIHASSSLILQSNKTTIKSLRREPLGFHFLLHLKLTAHPKSIWSFYYLSLINIQRNQTITDSMVLRAGLHLKKIIIHARKYHQTKPLRSCNHSFSVLR